ncbi:hypothetical protein BS329_32890 [Amycolatopsis coloradensis]|uniref:Uncharacterized protein n=1 Tax=Amycolatopsis coloradensis TaxID=76021 RepID=A0A1R0KHL5_9PSEU|nr:hypothetical protein [Amycolatopsis coloradensis]OLZ45243.1 hypothetical protein BS329_32890 [Amycolatopsis coloradensis]
MWRIGFYVWRVWLVAKYGVPAVGLLALIFWAQGGSPLFWTTFGVLGCVGLGMSLGVIEFRNQEFGKPRERIR